MNRGIKEHASVAVPALLSPCVVARRRHFAAESSLPAAHTHAFHPLDPAIAHTPNRHRSRYIISPPSPSSIDGGGAISPLVTIRARELTLLPGGLSSAPNTAKRQLHPIARRSCSAIPVKNHGRGRRQPHDVEIHPVRAASRVRCVGGVPQLASEHACEFGQSAVGTPLTANRCFGDKGDVEDITEGT